MNFVQQFGETMRSIDLGAAIGASGFKTIDLIVSPNCCTKFIVIDYLVYY